jgi:hypothetical protein
MPKGPSRYTLDQIKKGDWIVLGDGHMAVGWSSACDRDETRTIRSQVRQVRSVNKSVSLESRYCGVDRIDAEQVIAIFDSKETALADMEAAQAEWTARTPEIEELTQELNRLKRERFNAAYSAAARRSNR